MRASILALVPLLLGCPVEPEPEPEPEPELPPKVLVIGVDGLRGDGIGGAETPALDALIEAGVWTMTATTQLGAPTVSGPGWTSILTGVDADKHGIYGNGGWDELDRAYPTFLQRASDAGFTTAAAIHWLPIHVDIIEDDVLDAAVPFADDEEVTDGTVGLLEEDWDVHFVHLDDVDGAGHGFGFSIDVPEYVAAIEVVDGQIGRILDAVEARPTRAEERWLVAVTSDHGGAGTSHGGITDDHRLIPLIATRDGGPIGELTEGTESHLDVHPTVMTWLGVEPEPGWGLDGVAR